MTDPGKQEIITFKVDTEMRQALEHMPNRSAFIRTAILNALENTCPICRGTGVLDPAQKRHWEAFTDTHPLEECGHCHAVHPVCPDHAETVVHGSRS